MVQWLMTAMPESFYVWNLRCLQQQKAAGIGERILVALNLTQHRIHRELTLEQLARSAGPRTSFVSRVEPGVSTPLIGSAMGIGSAPGLSVKRLFGHAQGPDDPTIIGRAGDGANKDPTANLLLVAGANLTCSMRAFVSRPGNSGRLNRKMSHHDGEELLFVFKGRIELLIGKQLETLSACLFGACAPTGLDRSNPGDGPRRGIGSASKKKARSFQ
jgi:hypothetical protein